MKKGLLIYAVTVLLLISVLGVTYAYFTDVSKYTGSTFSVGSADLRLLEDLTLGLTPENLKDELPGPVFTNISPNWVYNYPIKLYNNATTTLDLTSTSNYETANDPAELRQIIYVETFLWEDTNEDGVVDEGELGASYGRKTVIKWKTEGFNLGSIETGTTKGILLRFTTDAVSPTKQGTTAIFDFEFNATGR